MVDYKELLLNKKGEEREKGNWRSSFSLLFKDHILLDRPTAVLPTLLSFQALLYQRQGFPKL